MQRVSQRGNLLRELGPMLRDVVGRELARLRSIATEQDRPARSPRAGDQRDS